MSYSDECGAAGHAEEGAEHGRRSSYQPLDRSRREFRLVRITGGSTGGPITCSLETASLDDESLEFTALSYVCGNEGITREILVDGHRQRVTANLESALRNFWAFGASETCGRGDDYYDGAEESGEVVCEDDDFPGAGFPEAEPDANDIKLEEQFQRWQNVRPQALRAAVGRGAFPVWVDSLCIDQEDLSEKSHQIQLMRVIYTAARCVLSWLGPPDEQKIDLALRLIGAIAPPLRRGIGFQWTRDYPLFRRGYNLKDPVLCGHEGWKAIKNFEDSEYFQRLWVFQELWATPTAIFICGDDHLPFIHLLKYHWWASFCHLFLLRSLFAVDQTVWDRLRTEIPVFNIVIQLMEAKHDFKTRGTSEAATHVMLARHLRCKDPRDKVYALLGPFPQDITPDYSMPVTEVYANWATDTRSTNPPGLLLTFSGIGLYPPSWEDISVPSWLPNLALLGGQTRGCEERNDYPVADMPDSLRPTVSKTSGIRCFGVEVTKVQETATCAFKTTKPGNDFKVNDFVLELKTHRLELLIIILQYLKTNKTRLCTESYAYDWSGLRLMAFMKTVQGCVTSLGLDQSSPSSRDYLSVMDFLPTEVSPASVFEKMLVYIREVLRPETFGEHQVALMGFSSEQDMWDHLLDISTNKNEATVELEETFELEEKRRLRYLVRDLLFVAMERRLFHTADGLIGGGPPGMERDDMVYLIHGSHMPVLLRRVDGKLRNVGVCYVHGISGGDGIKILEKREKDVREINIV
ncbi:hypothetical protein CONLIGDRAFT_679896 [Coniochaeta ligniaria NRRL 30616]|uniref:Heterokaryon incompatibility domain-containing protein n=1 Tax=Coniochaeta ligniaria NRRL 30616 TaxID=1408157 RepID=A0A1J7IUJ0_9PEZI|nr:hypothetical protein CONLIGDRAFT_679896 [Coniochaeta ligniaria NRRL 30616]